MKTRGRTAKVTSRSRAKSPSRVTNRGRTAPPDPRYEAEQWPMLFVPSGLHLSNDEMLSTSVVWACVRALVDPIASSEIKVFSRDANGRRVQHADDLSDRGVPVDYLLNIRPNPEITAQAFKEIVLSQTVIHGDGYAEIVRDRAGRVLELWPLQSEYMLPQRDPANGDLIYRYTQPGNDETVYLYPTEVLHVRGPSVLGLTGDSLVYRAAKAVALHVAQEKFATTYFANGTVLGGFVKFPAGIPPDTKERLREDFRKRFGGHKKAHGVAFLEAGMDYQAIGANAGESQLVPSRAFSVEEIARYFGVPLVRLGVQAAAQGYGTNVQQLNHQFVRDTLTPWVNRLTEEATYKLFPLKAPWRKIEIDTAWLTVGDAEQRARAAEINLRAGVLTVNEVREAEGLNGIGSEGDLHLVQSGLVVLDEENLQKPEPASASAPQKPSGPESEPGEMDDDMGAEMALRAAVEKYARQVRARRADLERNGKTSEEIAANIATTLRPKAVSAIASAIDGVEG